MNNTKLNSLLYFFLALSIGVWLYLDQKTDEPKAEKDKSFEIKEKMIDYDRYFLPYLYYATIGDSQGANQRIDLLTDAWYMLEIELDQYKQVAEIDENVYVAKQWLFASFDATDDVVHQFVSIDLNRFYLMEIRRRLEVDYYLDYLWQFEASLELVYEPAVDPMLCLLEFCELSNLVNDLNSDWNRFKELVPEDYFLNSMGISMTELEMEKSKLDLAIYKFNLSMETAMADQIKIEAQELNKAYALFLKNLIYDEYIEDTDNLKGFTFEHRLFTESK